VPPDLDALDTSRRRSLGVYLADPEGKAFLSRARLFTDQELAELEKAPAPPG